MRQLTFDGKLEQPFGRRGLKRGTASKASGWNKGHSRFSTERTVCTRCRKKQTMKIYLHPMKRATQPTRYYPECRPCRRAQGKDEKCKVPYRTKMQASCENCGFRPATGLNYLLEGHHVDGNRKNNKAENIQTLCPLCHRVLTNLGHIPDVIGTFGRGGSDGASNTDTQQRH